MESDDNEPIEVQPGVKNSRRSMESYIKEAHIQALQNHTCIDLRIKIFTPIKSLKSVLQSANDEKGQLPL